MHFIRGLNIGKKINRILSKGIIKTKVLKPLNYNFHENENLKEELNKFNKNFLNFHIKQYAKSISNKRIKSEDILQKEFFKYFIKNISLTNDKLFFLYFIMKYKSDKSFRKDNKINKKIYLGCSIKNNNTNNKGMKILAIKNGSPAEKNDLRVNDIILKINSNEINSIEEFNKFFNYSQNKSNSVEIPKFEFQILRIEDNFENLIRFNLNIQEFNLDESIM